MIPLFKVYSNTDAIITELRKVFESGYIGEGPKAKEFEDKLKEYFNTDYVLVTNSATSAEHLLYHMLKNKGAEVLTTPLTCTATNWPILANGFNLKWVDIDPTTMNIDLTDLERKITPDTRIINIVHWGGYPVDLDKLEQITERAYDKFGFKPIVVEDCAHAFGSTYKDKPIGNHGNFCTFSFQAIKHITSVDGGALVIPREENQFYKRGKLLRWYGINREENRKDFRCEADISEWGFKFHMNDVCATVGLANLASHQDIIKKNRSNASFYNEALKNLPGITLLENNPNRNSAYWLYTIRVKDRDGFIKKMGEKGIAASRVHERNDKHTCVKPYQLLLPNLEEVVKDMVCIPVGWWVSEEDRNYIVQTIKEGW